MESAGVSRDPPKGPFMFVDNSGLICGHSVTDLLLNEYSPLRAGIFGRNSG